MTAYSAPGIKLPIIDTVKQIVASYYGIPERMIANNSRCSYNVLPRHIAMYFSYKLRGKSTLKSLEHYFNRDATSITVSYYKILNKANKNKDFKNELEFLANKIGL